MKAVLSNPSHPEYGVATIPFPIPKTDYDNCIFTLTALGIGDVLSADCKVEEISEPSPVFQRMVGSAVNVDELDYLAKRLDSFDKRELAQFHAVAIGQDIHEIKDLINLTFCCQNVPIVQDFTDLEKVGRDCYMDRNGGASLTEIESLDFKQEARKLLLNEDGKVTQKEKSSSYRPRKACPCMDHATASCGWHPTAECPPILKNSSPASMRRKPITPISSCVPPNGHWRVHTRTRVSPGHRQKSAPIL